MKIQPRPCLHCGGPFTPQGNQLSRGYGRFCSLACVGLYRRVDSGKHVPATERTCAECGGVFVGRGGSLCRRCICKRAGAARGRLAPMTGERNPRWKGGISGTPEAFRAYHATYKAKHPEKYKARQRLRTAVRNGTIVPAPCADCGATNDPQAHHHDYSKPLEVTWLCRPCHLKRHGKLQAKEG